MMASHTLQLIFLIVMVGSSCLVDAQSTCMKKCLRSFLKCARLYDSGCCDSYIPCMRDDCKAKFYPCEQQTSTEYKRGSWNKRSEEQKQFYDMLVGRFTE